MKSEEKIYNRVLFVDLCCTQYEGRMKNEELELALGNLFSKR